MRASYHTVPLVVAAAALVAVAAAQQQGGQWVLGFEDHFNGTQLNPAIWNVRQNESHCSPCEAELYLARNVEVRDGMLVLTTKRETVMGPKGQVYNFTSGWVDTEAKWFETFGRFEIRARLPAMNATGAWPAFWTMPNPATSVPKDVCWPIGGEFDIFEATSNSLGASDIFGSYRWGTQCGVDMQPLPGSVKMIDFDEFHIFTGEWNSTTLVWAVDGQVFHNKTSSEVPIPQDPMYVIFDTAIAWYMPPTPSAVYPATFVIDYFKWYKWVPSN